MRHLALTAATLLAVAPAARADERARDRRELRQDHRELRQDRRAYEDDRRDLRRLEQLQAELDHALRHQDPRAVAAVDEALQRELAAERRETRREAAHEHRELRREAREGDRRDFRDDRRDLRVEGAMAGRRGQIGAELGSLRGRYGPGELERRRALLRELVQLARAELREDVREYREDRRELREDRREHREDREDRREHRHDPHDGGERPRY